MTWELSPSPVLPHPTTGNGPGVSGRSPCPYSCFYPGPLSPLDNHGAHHPNLVTLCIYSSDHHLFSWVAGSDATALPEAIFPLTFILRASGYRPQLTCPGCPQMPSLLQLEWVSRFRLPQHLWHHHSRRNTPQLVAKSTAGDKHKWCFGEPPTAFWARGAAHPLLTHLPLSHKSTCLCVCLPWNACSFHTYCQ